MANLDIDHIKNCSSRTERPTNNRSMSLQSFFPRAIRCRLPRFPSLRDSDSYIEGDKAQNQNHGFSSWDSPSRTPPPVYRSNASPTCSSEDLTSPPYNNGRRSQVSHISAPDLMLNSFCEAAETECGIKWRYAHQGILVSR
jgi:hypothetical protein